MRSPTLVRRCVALLALVPAARAASQTRVQSAPISAIHYAVTADSAAVGRHELGVSMRFHVDGPGPVVLALPAWSPGHYTLLWFARRVSQFSATADGVALDWHQVDYQTWQIERGTHSTMQVDFQYLADTIDRAVAWTRPDFSFFNGTNLFLYPVGRGFDWPATVEVHTEPSWLVATGMTRGSAPRSYTASTYHDLVDMPFFVGRFALDSARIATGLGDRWFRLAWYPASSLTAVRRDRTVDWLRKVVPPEAAVFGDVPFRDYTIFQVSDTQVNAGGLEHQSSQMDEVFSSQLDAVSASLYAHELFHAWNVKRLRPADLVPYRYDDAQPTRWLWVSEGLSDYYAGLALVRGAVSDSAAFFAGIADQIANVTAAPPAALSDASLSTWIAPTDGSAGLYYGKGNLVGFLLDIMIRDCSNNRRGLDDVMRQLYRTTYEQGKGFAAADWWSAVRTAAGGRSFDGFAKRYVDGRAALPIDSILNLAGLRAVTDTIREPRLGITDASDSLGARVGAVTETGAAAAAGVRAGDYIVSIGDVPMRNLDSYTTFRARYAGTTIDTLPMVVRRQGQTIPMRLPVRIIPRTVSRVLVAPTASAKEVRTRQGILRGTTEG